MRQTTLTGEVAPQALAVGESPKVAATLCPHCKYQCFGKRGVAGAGAGRRMEEFPFNFPSPEKGSSDCFSLGITIGLKPNFET